MTRTDWWHRFMKWICSWYGHDWVGDERGAPVIPYFIVCRRCRKWDRALKP